MFLKDLQYNLEAWMDREWHCLINYRYRDFITNKYYRPICSGQKWQLAETQFLFVISYCDVFITQTSFVICLSFPGVKEKITCQWDTHV